MEDPFDHFVDRAGGCGLFQVLIFLLPRTTLVGAFWGALFMSFGSLDPGWRCTRFNATGDKTGMMDVDNNTRLGQQMSRLNNSNSSQLDSIPGTCDIIDSCAEIHFSPESSTVVTEWGLICDKSWVSSMITSIQMVGILVGLYTSGRLADRFGRKFSLYSFVVVGAIANCVAAFSVSWEMFAALRFFIGVSTGANFCVNILYSLEFFNSKWRANCRGIPILTAMIGAFAAVAYILKDWRHIQLAISAAQVLSLLTYPWLPESIRWLVVNGKKKEVRQLADRICRINRKPELRDEDIDFKITDDSVEGLKNVRSFLLFKRPFLKRVICGLFICFTVSIMYYGTLFGIQIFFGNFYLNLVIFSIIGAPLYALIPMCGNKFGRRLGALGILSISGLLALGIVIVFLTVEDEVVKGWTINILAILTSSFADSAWGLFLVFIPELFPTPIRGTATSTVNIGEGIAGILAPYLLPKSYDLLYVSYIIIVGLCVICCCLTLALPETKDVSMESELAQCDRRNKTRGLVGNKERHSQLLGNGDPENF